MLPLTFFPEPCPYREAALRALAGSKKQWRIVSTSSSLAGVRAVAMAGLAVTPLPLQTLKPGLRVIGGNDKMPKLPKVEYILRVSHASVITHGAHCTIGNLAKRGINSVRRKSAYVPTCRRFHITLAAIHNGVRAESFCQRSAMRTFARPRSSHCCPPNATSSRAALKSARLGNTFKSFQQIHGRNERSGPNQANAISITAKSKTKKIVDENLAVVL